VCTTALVAATVSYMAPMPVLFHCEKNVMQLENFNTNLKWSPYSPWTIPNNAIKRRFGEKLSM